MISSILNFEIKSQKVIAKCNETNFTMYFLNTIERVVLLFSNLQYLNSITKEAENVSLKLSYSYLNVPAVSTTEKISQL